MSNPSEQELLTMVEQCLRDAERWDPHRSFHELVEMGLIDEEGRLRWEASEESMAAVSAASEPSSH